MINGDLVQVLSSQNKLRSSISILTEWHELKQYTGYERITGGHAWNTSPQDQYKVSVFVNLTSRSLQFIIKTLNRQLQNETWFDFHEAEICYRNVMPWFNDESSPFQIIERSVACTLAFPIGTTYHGDLWVSNFSFPNWPEGNSQLA